MTAKIEKHYCGYCRKLQPLSQLEGSDGLVQWRCQDACACAKRQKTSCGCPEKT